MSNTRSTNGVAPAQQTYFEQQRAVLLNDVASNLEHVLQNINLLNRSLESVIAVGNEFSQVEGLWSRFENVMAAQQQGQQQGESLQTGGGARDMQEQQQQQQQQR